jgi:type I restriction enzyme S subunit
MSISMSSISEQATSDQTRTYDRASSVVFLKTDEPFGGLSNMAGGFPLHVQGTRIFTCEALYQACRFPHLPEVQRLIIGQPSPMTAKMKSKPHRKDSRPDWDRVRVKVMRWCLRVKLTQNWAKFSELLLRTGDRPIVEESRRDDFWGAKPMDQQKLVGANVLGRLLMELREAVKSQGRDAFRLVEPPEIPEFLLLGRAIGVIRAGDVPHQEREIATAATAAVREAIQEDAPQASLFDGQSVKEAPAPAYTTSSMPERSTLLDLKPYPAMKDSDVPWLGTLPAHWKLRKLRGILRRVTERSRPDLPLLSVVRERGVIRRNTTDHDENRNFIPDDLSSYKVVRPGQFAMNKMKAWQGSYGVSQYEGIVSPAYFVFDIAEVEGRFFHTAIRSRAYVPSFGQASDGVRIGQWDLAEPRMREIAFAMPPSSEQSAIVRFLGYADRQIRRYIRAKQKLIGLLKEQKQAIIQSAVTRGLNPNVRLKPSGVAWLGDVPEHWEIRRAKALCSEIIDCKNRTPDAVEGGKYLVVRTTCIRGGAFDPSGGYSTDERNYRIWTARGAPQVGDVFFTREAPAGEACLVPERGDLCMGQRMMYFRPNPTLLDPEFLLLSIYGPLTRTYVELATNGSTVGHLRLGQVYALPLLWCPVDEQREIVRRVRAATAHLEQTRNDANHEIRLLREYRTRLIADVVTGKFDVREVGEQLSEQGEEPELFEDEDIEETGDEGAADDGAGVSEETEA